MTMTETLVGYIWYHRCARCGGDDDDDDDNDDNHNLHL